VDHARAASLHDAGYRSAFIAQLFDAAMNDRSRRPCDRSYRADRDPWLPGFEQHDSDAEPIGFPSMRHVVHERNKSRWVLNLKRRKPGDKTFDAGEIVVLLIVSCWCGLIEVWVDRIARSRADAVFEVR